ncbi:MULTISPECIES: TlpA disulfide reductase family protein [Streptacidiphilus]|uniref:TlpA family protein disulfide reductase n=1 Tax=Streptacidiphilus cavernicola TaxID=3342716 RepID=A0ABV6UPU5_9ACTN|nr:TlpA disulfide reductase family protein [Streptacidiphilus jeojiense]
MRPQSNSRPRTRHRVVAATALATALTVAGCSTSTGSGGAGDNAGSRVLPGTGLITAVKDRGTPLDLSGTTLDGKKFDLTGYRGKVVILNIWGSWCSACRAEADGLAAAAGADAAQGVQFVGVDTRDPQTAQPKAFVADHGIAYPNLYDPSGSLLLSFPRGALDPQFIPDTFVLDRQGRIAARALKAVSASELNRMLAPVLAEKS